MKKVTALVLVSVVFAGVHGSALARGTRGPGNDDAAAAHVISELPFHRTLETHRLTLEPDEPDPGCAPIAGSAWFALSPLADERIVARVSAERAAVLATYVYDEEGVLTRRSCVGGEVSLSEEFDARAGATYLFQVGSTKPRQGLLDLDVASTTWRETTLFEQVIERTSDETYVPLLDVEGRQRAENPSMYDITVGVSQQTPVKVGVLTFGLVTQPIDVETLRLPPSATKVSLTVSARYDTAQRACALDDGSSDCYGASPLRDPQWLTSGDGSNAELVVTVTATRNADIKVERRLAVPFAGQAGAMLP